MVSQVPKVKTVTEMIGRAVRDWKFGAGRNRGENEKKKKRKKEKKRDRCAGTERGDSGDWIWIGVAAVN